MLNLVLTESEWERKDKTTEFILTFRASNPVLISVPKSLILWIRRISLSQGNWETGCSLIGKSDS